MILTVLSVIFEKNMLELVDSNGRRYYYKGRIGEKLNFEYGDKVIF